MRVERVELASSSGSAVSTSGGLDHFQVGRADVWCCVSGGSSLKKKKKKTGWPRARPRRGGRGCCRTEMYDVAPRCDGCDGYMRVHVFESTNKLNFRSGTQEGQTVVRCSHCHLCHPAG